MYILLALLSKIPSINQYPLGISNDVIFQTAKIFTEDILGETVNTQPKLYLKKKNIENQYYNFDRNYKHISLGYQHLEIRKDYQLKNILILLNKFQN